MANWAGTPNVSIKAEDLLLKLYARYKSRLKVYIMRTRSGRYALVSQQADSSYARNGDYGSGVIDELFDWGMIAIAGTADAGKLPKYDGVVEGEDSELGGIIYLTDLGIRAATTILTEED